MRIKFVFWVIFLFYLHHRLLAQSTMELELNYPIGHIETKYGNILLWLYNETPNHKTSFIKLAEAGYWDSLTFNRVIPNFVIQGGCPDTEQGFSNSPYLIKPEIIDSLHHNYGALAAGRDENPEKISAGCQFYIVNNKNGLPRLDGRYTVFGKVISGFNVIDTISALPVDSQNNPVIPVKIKVGIIYLNKPELGKYHFQPE
jgi:peptidyl-prolyl cis-trans isomerase B (cyclophilin B)